MSDSPDALMLVDYIESRYLYTIYFLAGTIIVLYDTLLTFDKEVVFIWRRKVNLVSLLYVLNRYTRIAVCLSSVALFSPLSDKVCNFVATFQEVCVLGPYIAWAIFSAFRTYALSRRNVLLTSIVLAITILFTVPNVYSITTSIIYNDPQAGCLFLYKSVDNVHTQLVLVWVSRGALILSELTVLLLTLRAVYQARGSFRNQVTEGHTLPGVLLVNGVTCFLVPLMLNISTVVIYAANWTQDASQASGRAVQLLTVLRDSLTTTLISRFLLDLSGLNVYRDRGGLSINGEGMLTTQFSSHGSNVTFVLPGGSDQECS
ncbi:hypothetical protein C8Q76DRAFT_858803 [Earliella scabrosa]|nr:hypothetical protein C8Q76DRAFT_858803 [Earliella scabrosa]